jgi:hypothetical protein
MELLCYVAGVSSALFYLLYTLPSGLHHVFCLSLLSCPWVTILFKEIMNCSSQANGFRLKNVL